MPPDALIFSNAILYAIILYGLGVLEMRALPLTGFNEYICIVMGRLIQRTDQEILMGFVASCIEDAADKLGLDYAEVYERMKAVEMIDKYIIPHYDVLHSESRENVTAGIIDTLKRWEELK